jgi:hypothetical protein
VRPLRFAIFVACASAICIALGRLWVQSLDQGSGGPVARVFHAGTGAVGVAIAGVDRQFQAHRLATPRRRQIIEAAEIMARPDAPSTLQTNRIARTVGVAVARTPPAAHRATPKAPVAQPQAIPVVNVTPTPKPVPAPKPKPKPKPKPSPAPTPTPAPTPAPPVPAPPTPAPPTPAPPTPAPPAPAPPAPPAPAPSPPNPVPPTPPSPGVPTAPAPQPPDSPTPPLPPDGDTRPGYGYGDDNHEHTGPPGHDHDHGEHGHGHGSGSS